MFASTLTIIGLPLFLGNLRGWEIVIIILAILLFFGAKKIPELMRNMGKGINSFKQGMREMQDEINKAPEQGDSSNKTDNTDATK